MRRRPLAAAAGLVADMALGEPPVRPHPVSVFGAWMRMVEGRIYRDRRSAGVAHACVGVATGAAAGALLHSTAASTYLAVAQHELTRAAAGVRDSLVAGDIVEARRRLPALVGRDVDDLDDKEVARAVVESVAENCVDAVVAPVLWAAVGGAPAVLAYRAANTLDSTVGHRSPRYRRYGWASARLDDAANFVPARLTAALVMTVRPRCAGAVWRATRGDARAHPSPNAGVAEAAYAAALGLRLGGPNRYQGRLEVRPSLGDGRPPEPGDIDRAVALCRDVSVLLAALLAASGVLG